MTSEERIDLLEGEVRAAIFAGADTLASVLREVVPDPARRASIAADLRLAAGRANMEGRATRADMLEMAADMLKVE